MVTGHYPRHAQKESLAFMNVLDRRVPSGFNLPGVLDNPNVHEGEPVQRWLRRQPRFVFRIVPTSSAWTNMVEGWLGHL